MKLTARIIAREMTKAIEATENGDIDEAKRIMVEFIMQSDNEDICGSLVIWVQYLIAYLEKKNGATIDKIAISDVGYGEISPDNLAWIEFVVNAQIANDQHEWTRLMQMALEAKDVFKLLDVIKLVTHVISCKEEEVNIQFVDVSMN